jgi:hypothetical protein
MPRVSYTQDEVAEAMLDVTDNGLSKNKSTQKREISQPTLTGRLRSVPPTSEVTHPAQLLSKPEESRLVSWILRQEALGYAPSHSQVRATVTALLRQQQGCRQIRLTIRYINQINQFKPDIEFYQINQLRYRRLSI